MATTLGTLLLLIKGDTKDLKSKLSDADKSILSFAKNMTRMGNQLRSTGKQLTTELTLPLVGLAVAALKSAGQLDEFKKPLDDMRNSLRGAMADILRGALPVLQGLAKAVSGVASWFSNLSDGAKQTLLILAGIAAAIGPSLVVVGRLVTVIGFAQRAFVAAKVAALSFNATMVSNPIWLVVAALGALAGVVLLLRGRQQNLKKEMADVLALSKEQALVDRERGRQVIVDAMLAHNKALREAKTANEQATAAAKLYSGAQNSLQPLVNKTTGEIKDHQAAITALAEQLRRFDLETKQLNDRQVEGITIINGMTDAVTDEGKAAEISTGKLQEFAMAIDPLAKAASARSAFFKAFWGEEEEAATKADVETQTLTEKLQEYGALASSIFGDISEIVALSFQNQTAALENEEAARRKAIESSITDETARAVALEELDTEFEARRTELARRQAEKSRSMAIFQSLLDTANAVVSALASVKPTVPLGILASILVGGLGLAKTALIAATPLPALAKGGSFDVPPGYPNDSFQMRVETGEHVDVTPADQVARPLVQAPLIIGLDGTPIWRGLLQASRNGIALIAERAVVR